MHPPLEQLREPLRTEGGAAMAGFTVTVTGILDNFAEERGREDKGKNNESKLEDVLDTELGTAAGWGRVEATQATANILPALFPATSACQVLFLLPGYYPLLPGLQVGVTNTDGTRRDF